MKEKDLFYVGVWLILLQNIGANSNNEILGIIANVMYIIILPYFIYVYFKI